MCTHIEQTSCYLFNAGCLTVSLNFHCASLFSPGTMAHRVIIVWAVADTWRQRKFILRTWPRGLETRISRNYGDVNCYSRLTVVHREKLAKDCNSVTLMNTSFKSPTVACFIAKQNVSVPFMFTTRRTKDYVVILAKHLQLYYVKERFILPREKDLGNYNWPKVQVYVTYADIVG